jgi:hypothetical protein
MRRRRENREGFWWWGARRGRRGASHGQSPRLLVLTRKISCLIKQALSLMVENKLIQCTEPEKQFIAAVWVSVDWSCMRGYKLSFA